MEESRTAPPKGRDVSARQRAEEALRESEERFRKVFENAATGISITDWEGRLQHCNPAFCALLGYTEEEFRRMDFASLIHAEDRDRNLAEIRRLQAGELPFFEIENRYVRKDGQPVWVHKFVSVLPDATGRPVHLLALVTDVTERKRAEGTLRRLNEELEQRVEERTEELRETVAQLEEEMSDREEAEQKAAALGRLYRLLTRVYEAIVHAQEQEGLFRQACRIMMEEGDFLLCWIGRVDWQAGLVRAAAQFDLLDDYPQNITISLGDVPEGRGPTGVAVRQGRWDVCLDIAADPRMDPWRKEARARGFKSSAAFPLFVGGRVEGVLTLYSGQKGFFDTEEISALNSLAQEISFAMESMDREARRRQAEAEIHRLNEELEQRVKERTAQLEFANRELEAFTYSVSHDLKAPIRAIQGFSRMLASEHASRLDEEGLRLLDVIVDNTRTMGNLINDLLALSRLERQQLSKSVVDMEAISKQAFLQLWAEAPGRDLQLIVADPPPAFGDPKLLTQVMLNLLDNAIKYTKSRKSAVIEVGGQVADQETVYYVKDSGVGFDERYAGNLFGVFQRLHGREEYEGSGVGLAIVQRLVLRHGGRVWAEGKVNQGATFFFALPKE